MTVLFCMILSMQLEVVYEGWPLRVLFVLTIRGESWRLRDALKLSIFVSVNSVTRRYFILCDIRCFAFPKHVVPCFCSCTTTGLPACHETRGSHRLLSNLVLDYSYMLSYHLLRLIESVGEVVGLTDLIIKRHVCLYFFELLALIFSRNHGLFNFLPFFKLLSRETSTVVLVRIYMLT